MIVRRPSMCLRPIRRSVGMQNLRMWHLTTFGNGLESNIRNILGSVEVEPGEEELRAQMVRRTTNNTCADPLMAWEDDDGCIRPCGGAL